VLQFASSRKWRGALRNLFKVKFPPVNFFKLLCCLSELVCRRRACALTTSVLKSIIGEWLEATIIVLILIVTGFFVIVLFV
jgi:hypothetical protein